MGEYSDCNRSSIFVTFEENNCYRVNNNENKSFLFERPNEMVAYIKISKRH